MSLRYLAGFITASYNPLKVPNAPTITTVTAGDTQLTVAFTAPSNVGGGAITSYLAIATSGAGAVFTATGSASPITITGLTNGTAYTVQVLAINAFGPGPYSVGVSGTPVPPRKLFTWGRNNLGQLGQNNIIGRSSPVQVGALGDWDLVASSEYASVAVKTNGTLWAWGVNNQGQLGDGTIFNRSSPVQIGALTTWLTAASGYYSSFAIKTDGTLWAWGGNNNGQLGQNNRVSYSSPVQIGALTNWAKVSGGNFPVLAVKTDGTLWSWGSNANGGLGQNVGITTARSSPVQVGALSNWSNVFSSMNTATSMATKTDGTLWTWGSNANGVLGLGDVVNRSSPVQIGALTNWSRVSLGNSHCLSVKTDGTLWSWGWNASGQLGQNSVISRSSPVQVGALNTWTYVAAGKQHSLSTKSDGTLWTWGYNDFGQLGQNDRVYRSSPVQVGSATTWVNVTALGDASLAISN